MTISKRAFGFASELGLKWNLVEVKETQMWFLITLTYSTQP